MYTYVWTISETKLEYTLYICMNIHYIHVRILYKCIAKYRPKIYINQTTAVPCPREWRVSAVMCPNLGHALKLCVPSQHYRSEGFKEGSLIGPHYAERRQYHRQRSYSFLVWIIIISLIIITLFWIIIISRSDKKQHTKHTKCTLIEHLIIILNVII